MKTKFFSLVAVITTIGITSTSLMAQASTIKLKSSATQNLASIEEVDNPTEFLKGNYKHIRDFRRNRRSNIRDFRQDRRHNILDLRGYHRDNIPDSRRDRWHNIRDFRQDRRHNIRDFRY